MLTERETRKQRVTDFLVHVGTDYLKKGHIRGFEIHTDTDVHAFYRPAKTPSAVIHVQGYPGLSSEDKMAMVARLMDYQKMQMLRIRGVSIGNEHEAVVENLTGSVDIPYEGKELERIIESSAIV